MSVTNDFIGISAISDADFNDIPAGQPIDSKIRICATSPYKFIASGYKDEAAEWPQEMVDNHKYIWYDEIHNHPVYGFLDEMGREDLILLDRTIYLKFSEIPEIKSHNITVSFLMENGKVERTIPVQF